jgi:phage terminase large subunit-like protein
VHPVPDGRASKCGDDVGSYASCMGLVRTRRDFVRRRPLMLASFSLVGTIPASWARSVVAHSAKRW